MRALKYLSVVAVPIASGIGMLALLANWGPVDRPRLFWNWPTHSVPAWVLLGVWFVIGTLLWVFWLSLNEEDDKIFTKWVIVVGSICGIVCALLVASTAQRKASNEAKNEDRNALIAWLEATPGTTIDGDTITFQVSPDCRIHFSIRGWDVNRNDPDVRLEREIVVGVDDIEDGGILSPCE